ncbi:hypothetical protein BD769DRAFT_1392395 [Suillus cothurnatus]|nr:hypothetical protein BD769DRAFT_1392395 [Suillus cothurnatus]
MSTPVDTSLASLKEITAQIVGIISGSRQIPAGNAHMALTSQVTDLVEGLGHLGLWERSPHPRHRVVLLKGVDHAWCPKILAWEALGDHSFDLPVAVPPSVGPIPVDLPSPPIVTDNAASSSTNTTTKSRAMVKDKGKGKADLELEVDGSRKRKSPMMSALPSQPLKSAMKGRKWMRSARIAKLRMVVESEDDEDPVIQPSGSGVLEVILPLLSTIDSRTPRSPHSPRSPKKQTFGPVSYISAQWEVFQVLLPLPAVVRRLLSPPKLCLPSQWRLHQSLMQVTFSFPAQTIHAMLAAPTSGPVQVAGTRGPAPFACPNMGTPPKRVRGKSTTHQTRSGTPSTAPSNVPSTLQLRACTCSQSCGPSGPPAASAVTTPKAPKRSHSKTITAVKAPAPAPAPASIPSSSSTVPCAALDLPMPDLHAMVLAIRDGAAQIAILESCVVEQDDLPGNATLLLDQSIPTAMSPPASALPALIDLSMTGMEPTPPTFQDASSIEGLIFEPTEGQPEEPQTSGNMVDPGDPGNLVPEYNSDDMDVEVKVEEDVDIAT